MDCDGCSFKCIASDCDCTCHTGWAKRYAEKAKKMERDRILKIIESMQTESPSYDGIRHNRLLIEIVEKVTNDD